MDRNRNRTKFPSATIPSRINAPTRSIDSTIGIGPRNRVSVLCDPEANQLVQGVSGGRCTHEFVEVLRDIEIERRTRQAQHSAGEVSALAIIEMTHQAESAELRRYDIGG